MDRDGATDRGCIELNEHRLCRSTDMIRSELRELYNYWNRLRAGRDVPLRSEIDPRDMTCDARNLFLLEDLGRGNIRFRLAGTALVEAFGMELLGMSAQAIMAAKSRETFVALVCETLEDPGIGYARLRNSDDEMGLWEMNLLPLRSLFGTIDRVIGCLHPLNAVASRHSGFPLRFSMEHMSIEPIETTMRDCDSFTKPVEAFLPRSEDAPECPARLIPIEGGGRRASRQRNQRDHLRLVKH